MNSSIQSKETSFLSFCRQVVRAPTEDRGSINGKVKKNMKQRHRLLFGNKIINNDSSDLESFKIFPELHYTKSKIVVFILSY